MLHSKEAERSAKTAALWWPTKKLCLYL